jgi:hypothetical protein
MHDSYSHGWNKSNKWGRERAGREPELAGLSLGRRAALFSWLCLRVRRKSGPLWVKSLDRFGAETRTAGLKCPGWKLDSVGLIRFMECLLRSVFSILTSCVLVHLLSLPDPGPE